MGNFVMLADKINITLKGDPTFLAVEDFDIRSFRMILAYLCFIALEGVLRGILKARNGGRDGVYTKILGSVTIV